MPARLGRDVLRSSFGPAKLARPEVTGRQRPGNERGAPRRSDSGQTSPVHGAATTDGAAQGNPSAVRRRHGAHPRPGGRTVPDRLPPRPTGPRRRPPPLTGAGPPPRQWRGNRSATAVSMTNRPLAHRPSRRDMVGRQPPPPGGRTPRRMVFGSRRLEVAGVNWHGSSGAAWSRGGTPARKAAAGSARVTPAI